MSECVVRMEMPKRCDFCDFWHVCKNVADFGAARYFEEPRELTVGMKGCKIVCQLPEGHGRLVDADELRNKLIKNINLTNGFDTSFRETATIVPAEAEPPKEDE
jgi:hypothetical protein